MPRLDRGILSVAAKKDCPVEPDNNEGSGERGYRYENFRRYASQSGRLPSV